MDRLLLAPLTVLFKLDLAGNKLFVLATPIVNTLAIFAREFDESFL